MKNEKRFTRGYKVRPSAYKKAMARAKKEKGTLANLVENVVIAYGYGLKVKVCSGPEDQDTTTVHPTPDNLSKS